jgi:hypothetical protein
MKRLVILLVLHPGLPLVNLLQHPHPTGDLSGGCWVIARSLNHVLRCQSRQNIPVNNKGENKTQFQNVSVQTTRQTQYKPALA